MKSTTYVCDRCDKPIDGKTYGFPEIPRIEIPETMVQDRGYWDACLRSLHIDEFDRHVPKDGWHFHGDCFGVVVDAIKFTLKK